MIIDPIPLSGPSITHREIDYAADAAAVGWNMREAEYIFKLQKLLAQHAGQPYAFAVSSRTAALHLAMLALGIGPGDEVLVPEIADVSAAYCVMYTGAKPVFCDVDRITLCLSPDDAAKKVTSATKALIAVHLYGQLCDMEALQSLTDAHGIALLEDATQGLGSEYGGRKAGSFGLFAAVSFNSNEAVTCGQGGMLLGRDKDLMNRAAMLGMRGRSAGNPFVYESLGLDYALSNIQASLGVAQMERFDEILEKKRAIFSWYKERLSGVPGIRLNSEPQGASPSFLMTTLFIEDAGVVRTAFLKRLAASAIMAAPVFYPLSSMPVFAKTDNPVAFSVGARALLLPSGCNRTEDEVDYIASAVKQLLAVPSLPKATVQPSGWLATKSETLEAIKNAKQKGLRIPFTHAEQEFYLRAVTVDDAGRPEIVSFMGDFRRDNMHVFLKRHEVTDELMRETMSQYINRDRDFLLFFVARLNENGLEELLGHMGLDNFDFQKKECVAEAFMMHPDIPRGLAASASDAMYAWAKQTLGITKVYNHMVGSNKKVRLLAASQGFREINRTPLYKQDLGNEEYIYRPMYIAGHDEPDEIFVYSVKEL